jgi:predicted thioesterase
MDDDDVRVGGTATVSAEVTAADTAEALGSGDLPVYATPALVALLERAACACLVGHLPPGRTSVGTRMDVAHVAASPVGATVTATAVVTAVDGRQIDFDVSAADAGGEVAHGRHTRVVVSADRFVAKAGGRLSRP